MAILYWRFNSLVFPHAHLKKLSTLIAEGKNIFAYTTDKNYVSSSKIHAKFYCLIWYGTVFVNNSDVMFLNNEN